MPDEKPLTVRLDVVAVQTKEAEEKPDNLVQEFAALVVLDIDTPEGNVITI